MINDIADSLQSLFSATFDAVAKEEGEAAVKTIKKEIKQSFQDVFGIKGKETLESHMGIKFDRPIALIPY